MEGGAPVYPTTVERMPGSFRRDSAGSQKQLFCVFVCVFEIVIMCVRYYDKYLLLQHLINAKYMQHKDTPTSNNTQRCIHSPHTKCSLTNSIQRSIVVPSSKSSHAAIIIICIAVTNY